MKIKKTKRPRSSELTRYAPAYEAWVQKRGTNSEISLRHYFDSGERKIVARYGGQKGGFSYKEALQTMQRLSTYQKYLEDLNVPISPMEQLILEYNPTSRRAVITKISPWVGSEVTTLFERIDKKNLPFARRLIGNMLSILQPVCRARRKGWETRIGIDPRVANFTLDAAGKMWFVDIFPPRYRHRSGPLVEWPAPKSQLGHTLGYFKHYDVRGIVLCFLSQLGRANPAHRIAFESTVLEFLSKFFSEEERRLFIQGLEQTSWKKVRALLGAHASLTQAHKRQIIALIRGASRELVFGYQYYVYALREIALELTSAGLMSNESLEDFFRKSHFEDELPSRNLQKLEKQLSSVIWNA